jgi:superfamily II DNA helicase RecQ
MTLFGKVAAEKSSKTSRKTRPLEPAVKANADGKKRRLAIRERVQFNLPYETLSQQAHALLRKVFGFQKLRGLQPQAVECALRRQSQIIVMATGGGKSLCYQLPALAIGGTTLVISPLKALIADQVRGLLERGIAATFLSSQLTEAAKTDVMERVLQRSLRSRSKPADCASWKGKFVTLLYLTPEMVQTERCRSALLELHKSGRLTGFAVDEAHCVSSWYV